MPSPRLLKLLTEGLSEAPQGLRRASQELPQALLEGLKKTPELAEALLQVLGKVKAKAPGIADALQEAAAQFLSGQKTPEMIRKAKEARSIAIGEHMMGTGRKQAALEVAEKPKPDPSQIGEFIPAHRPPVSPEEVAGPRSLRRQGEVESKVGGLQAQMSKKEIDTFWKKAFSEDPKYREVFGPSTASEERHILRPARRRLGIQEPQVPSQAIAKEAEVIPPGKQIYKSPKGSGKGARLSSQEAQARAASEAGGAAGTWGKMTEQLPLPIPRPLPQRSRVGEAPKGYAQFLPKKGEAMPEIRPGPTRPQSGPGVVSQPSYDPTAPAPKIEMVPEDIISPEVQQLYRRIILGKE